MKSGEYSAACLSCLYLSSGFWFWQTVRNVCRQTKMGQWEVSCSEIRLHRFRDLKLCRKKLLQNG